MPDAKFKVGQMVRLSPRQIGQFGAGKYKIVSLLPEEHGINQYRLQSSESHQQRVAWEYQLVAIGRAS